MTTTDADTKTLVEEMNRAYWSQEMLCKTQTESMQAAARVMWRRIHELNDGDLGARTTTQLTVRAFLNAFAREHGLDR